MSTFNKELDYLFDDQNLTPILFEYYDTFVVEVTRRLVKINDVNIIYKNKTIVETAVADKQFLYVATYDRIYCYDHDGKLVAENSLSGCKCRLLPEQKGKLYVIAGKYISLFNWDGTNLIKILKIPHVYEAMIVGRNLFMCSPPSGYQTFLIDTQTISKTIIGYGDKMFTDGVNFYNSNYIYNIYTKKFEPLEPKYKNVLADPKSGSELVAVRNNKYYFQNGFDVVIFDGIHYQRLKGHRLHDSNSLNFLYLLILNMIFMSIVL